MGSLLDARATTAHLAKTSKVFTDGSGRRFVQVDDMLLPLRDGDFTVLDVAGTSWPDGRVA